MSDLKFVVMCNTIIVAIFSYAVFVLDHSGWWFFLMCVLFDTYSEKNPTRPNKDKQEAGDG